MSSIVERAQQAKQATEEKLKRGGGSMPSLRWWRPANGKNQIRVMPPWDKDGEFKDQFFREVAQHWNIGDEQKAPVLCPKQTPGLEGDCPICEFVEALKADKTDVKAQKLAKEFRAKTAYLLNVVSLKDPEYTAEDVAEFKQNQPDKDCPFEVGDPKVQVYACPLTVFDSIVGLIASSGKDITRLKDGRNITINKIANKDRFKTRYEVYPDFDPSEFELPENHELPDLCQVGFKMNYDEMLDLLNSGEGSNHTAALPSGAAASLPASSKASKSPEEDDTDEGDEDLEAKMRAELDKG